MMTNLFPLVATWQRICGVTAAIIQSVTIPLAMYPFLGVVNHAA